MNRWPVGFQVVLSATTEEENNFIYVLLIFVSIWSDHTHRESKNRNSENSMNHAMELKEAGVSLLSEASDKRKRLVFIL